jgi:hypothetical protein
MSPRITLFAEIVVANLVAVALFVLVLQVVVP